MGHVGTKKFLVLGCGFGTGRGLGHAGQPGLLG